jgi:hypothetical protein
VTFPHELSQSLTNITTKVHSCMKKTMHQDHTDFLFLSIERSLIVQNSISVFQQTHRITENFHLNQSNTSLICAFPIHPLAFACPLLLFHWYICICMYLLIYFAVLGFELSTSHLHMCDADALPMAWTNSSLVIWEIVSHFLPRPARMAILLF